MKVDEFNKVIEMQIQRSKDVLIQKAKEYATGDRLHNFKIAAALEGVSARQALAGMMAKHTVSVYDMCMSDKDYPMSMWEEKITDHMNYLLLLTAVIVDDMKKHAIKESMTIDNISLIGGCKLDDPELKKAMYMAQQTPVDFHPQV